MRLLEVSGILRGTMRNLISRMVLLSVLVLNLGCPSITPVVPTTAEVVDCAKEAAKDIFFTLQPRVSTIIATSGSYQDYASALLPLITKYGIEVVTCVVESVMDRNAQSAKFASGDEKELHERNVEWSGRWLQEQGAKIK